MPYNAAMNSSACLHCPILTKFGICGGVGHAGSSCYPDVCSFQFRYGRGLTGVTFVCEEVAPLHAMKECGWSGSKGRLKCDGTRAETRFRLSAKRTSPFKSAGASVQSTTGSRGVRISGSNAGYTMFRGSVKGTGYPLHSQVSPSLPLLCVTVCHHISAGVCGPSSIYCATVRC